MQSADELGVWAWDMDSDHVVWENQRPFEIFGLPPGAPPVDAATFTREFMHPDDAALFAEAVRRARQGGQSFHFAGRIRRRSDGCERWVEIIGRNAERQGSVLLGTVADVTERKLAEERLRLSEAKYRALFDSMDEGYCLLEVLFDDAGTPQDYRFVETNPAFVAQTGLARAEGRTVRELVPDIERHWIDIYAQVARTGTPRRFVQHSPALGRWFNAYATPMPTPAKTLVGVLFNDVTGQRNTEDALRRLAAELSQADQRKDQFLAMLAHELRNPLAPLRSGLEVLRKAPDDTAMLQRTRPMMERQLRQLEHLVNDLLDVARINDGSLSLRREHVRLDTLVRTALEASQPQIDAAGHALQLDLPPTPLWLDADPTRIAQVLSNLLNNAAMATAPGGQLVLRVRRRVDAAEICVIDNGAGMDVPTLERVKHKLGQEDDMVVHEPDGDGFGVGLALVHRLVLLHGGQVQVHSDGPGKGSQFTVRLPLHPAHDTLTAEPHAVASQPGAADLTPGIGRRVLVVDDNRDAGDSLAMLLQLSGHTTRVAYNGAQALDAARDFVPQLVFLDIGMPGMDGYAVAKALRQDPRMRHALLVALTGWGAEDDRERTRAAGFDHHLTKPADPLAIDAVLLAADGRCTR